MKKKDDWIEELKQNIIDGVYDQYYLKERRIIERIDGKVKRFMLNREVTPELESKMVNWFDKYSDKPLVGSCNIWDGFISLVADEGEVVEENGGFSFIGRAKWRDYILTQYTHENEMVMEIKRKGKLVYQKKY